MNLLLISSIFAYLNMPTVIEAMYVANTEVKLKEKASHLNALVYWGKEEKVAQMIEDEPHNEIASLLTFETLLRIPLETALHQKHYNLADYLLTMMKKYVRYDSIDQLFCRLDECILFGLIEKKDLTAIKFVVEACEGEGVDICGLAKDRSGLGLKSYARIMTPEAEEIRAYFEEKCPSPPPSNNSITPSSSGGELTGSSKGTPKSSPRKLSSSKSHENSSDSSASNSSHEHSKSADSIGRKRKLSGLSIRLRSASLSPRRTSEPSTTSRSAPISPQQSAEELGRSSSVARIEIQITSNPKFELTPASPPVSEDQPERSGSTGRLFKLGKK